MVEILVPNLIDYVAAVVVCHVVKTTTMAMIRFEAWFRINVCIFENSTRCSSCLLYRVNWYNIKYHSLKLGATLDTVHCTKPQSSNRTCCVLNISASSRLNTWHKKKHKRAGRDRGERRTRCSPTTNYGRCGSRVLCLTIGTPFFSVTESALFRISSI